MHKVAEDRFGFEFVTRSRGPVEVPLWPAEADGGPGWEVSDVGEDPTHLGARRSAGKEGGLNVPGHSSRAEHSEWSVLNITKSRRKEGELVLPY